MHDGQNVARCCIVIAIAWVFLSAPMGCASPNTPLDPEVSGAVIDVKFTSPDTMRILVRDADAIRKVERFLREQTPYRLIPFGYVTRGKGIDPRYEFHYIPESVMFAEGGIEACQYPVTLMRTAEQLHVFFGSRDTAQWCPAAIPIAISILP